MPATNKQGTQLLVDEWVLTEGRALALIRQDSVASIWRYLIEAQLPIMKSAHYGALTELDRALKAIGGDRAALIEQMTTQKIRFGDLFDAAGEPLGVMPTPAGWRATGERTRAGALKA